PLLSRASVVPGPSSPAPCAQAGQVAGPPAERGPNGGLPGSEGGTAMNLGQWQTKPPWDKYEAELLVKGFGSSGEPGGPGSGRSPVKANLPLVQPEPLAPRPVGGPGGRQLQDHRRRIPATGALVAQPQPGQLAEDPGAAVQRLR